LEARPTPRLRRLINQDMSLGFGYFVAIFIHGDAEGLVVHEEWL
jgi:hypothetical protein